MKLIKNIFHKILTLLAPSKFRTGIGTCEELAIYLSNGHDFSSYDKVFFKAHLYICQDCRAFQTQIIKLDDYKNSKFKEILEKTVDENKAQSIANKIKKSI